MSLPGQSGCAAFLRRLQTGPPLLLDGGLGSMLIDLGLSPGQPPDAWNLEWPERVASVHRRYVEAGSEAVHANTFGGHPARLRRFGLEDQLEVIQERAVRLARDSGARFVLGDVGPTGEYLPPIGGGVPEEWRRGYQRQARALAACSVDALHLETFSDLREATLALSALQAEAVGIPVMVSLTFERKPRGFYTLMGDPLVSSLRALLKAGACAVGANCTLTSTDMVELARAAGREPLPLVIQPNAGQPEPSEGACLYRQDPAVFAGEMAAMVAADFLAPGARLAALGGCCGTNPRFIAALHARLGARIPGGGQPR